MPSLALLDVRADELQETARVSEHHVPPLQLVADVGDEAEVARAFAQVESAWGGLDAVVAAAGISMSVTGDARVDQLELAVWERILRTNLTGCSSL